MTTEDKLKFKHYEELHAEYINTQAELDFLRTQLLDIMQKEEKDQIKSDQGTFSRASKKTWIYLPIVDSQEKALKTMKLEQQRIGSAKFTEEEYLVYRTNKE